MEEKDLNIILKDFIATYMNPSYGGDFDLVKSKFPELDNQDPQVLKDYLATYLNPQYNGDIELVNSKFPELFQKKNLSGQGFQTGSEMSDTGSTLSQDSEPFKDIKPASTFVKTEEEIQGGAIDNLFSAAKSSWKNVKGLSAGVVDEVVDMAKANVNAAGIPGLMAVEYSKVKSLGDKGKFEFQKKLNEYKEKQKKEAAEIEYDPNTLSGMIGAGAVYAAPSVAAIATAPFNPALAVGIGVAGTVAMTSTALVNGMDTYDDYKESKGLPSDPFARLGVGTAFMASEAAMEAIPLAKFLPKNIKTKVLGRFLKDIPEEILEKKGKDLLEAFQKSSSSNKKLVQDLGKEVITGFGTEGFTEGATEFSNKMVQFIYQDAEDNKLDSEFFSEIGYAVLAGGVIGSGLGPLSYGSTNLSNKKRRERQKELVFAQNNKTGEVFEIASVNKDSGIVKVINKAGQSSDVDINDINMAEAVKISNTEFSKFLKNSKESRSKSKDIKDVPDVGTEMMLNGSKVKVVSVNEDSSSVDIQDASGDVFEVPLSELSEFNDQYKEIVNLQFGEISYDFTKEKDGTLSFSEGDMNKDQAESTASMLNETYKGMDFSISEIPSTDPLVPSTYKINAKEKVSTDPSYKIDGATMDKPRFVEAINEATKEDSLNELETNDPEVQKLIDQKRSEITGIPITESVDAELNQEVEQLRAQEQAELVEALTDPEQYMVDGVIDGDKITDPAEKKIFDDIYKKYDERITPLLEASKATPETAKDSVKEYVEELNKTKSSDPETYWSVDEVSPESAAEGTIIKDEDGYGVVGKDGDIKGVFKRLESKARGVAQKILKKAIEAGGIKLDNFDTYLTGVYKKAGFRVVSRTKFNEEFAPDGWSKEKHGTPDVVAMVYDPDNKLNIEERLFDDPENGYDQMIEYRDSFVEQAKSLYPVAVKESTQTKAAEVKKPEDTNKKTETDKKDAVIESIKKAGEVLKLAFPNVKMIVGTNVKDTRAKIEKELTPSIGAKAAKKIADSFDNANGQAVFSNGKPIAVIINQGSAELSTAPHEVWHLILRDVFGKNPKKFEEFRNGVANSLINNGFENIAEFLDNFSSLYDGDITYEEYLAELGGQLVAQRVDPSKFSAKEKSFIQEFKELINKIARDVIGRDVFLKDATPENILEFMSNVSAVMAEGGDVRTFIKDSKTESKEGGIDAVMQADFSDIKSGLTFIYDKNSERFDKLKKDGFINEEVPLSNFNGMSMVLHSPDAAFSGEIKKDGESLIEGKGGLFYTAKFHDENYFWASTAQGARGLVNRLNEVSEKNGGKILMALTSAPYHKLLSSVTMSNAVLDFFTSKAFDSRFKLTQSDLKKSLISAANHSEKSKDGKMQGLKLKLSGSLSIADIKSEISKALSVNESNFDSRKIFAKELIGQMTNVINKSDVSIKQFGELFSKGIQNDYFKGFTKTGKIKLSKTNMIQALSEMFTEPLLKEGFEDRSKGGQVYAVLEVDGKVEVVNSDLHESYPIAIKSKNPVKIHILKDRPNWMDSFVKPNDKSKVSKAEKQKIFPSSGVSSMGLEVFFGDVEVTSQKELPSRVNQQINDIISEQRALEKKPAEISKEAIKYLKGTEAYAKLSDRLKKKVIDGVKRLSGMRVKVTVDEYASLKDQIKLEAKAAREVNFSNKSAIKQLSSAVKDMVSKGKISTFKASVIIRRIARTNFLDQSSVNSTISYIADVFDNANLAMKISRATSLIKAARKNAKSKLGQNIDLYTAVKSLLSVETSLIPTPMIDDYLSVLEILGERAKVLTIKDVGDTVSKINVILNSVKDKTPVAETQSKKETVEESVEASKSLMKDILSSPINTSKVSDVNDSAIARFLASITRKDLEGLLKTNSDGTINRSDLKTLAAVISNIEAGLVTNQAIVLAEKIDKNRRVAKLKNTVSNISTRRLTIGVSRAIGKIKGVITGKTGILEAIRATPLEFIDDVVGNYNDRTLRDAIFGKLASQKGKLDGRIADLLAKGEAAESLFNKGRTDNNAVRAKYKVMAYLIQKEHDSNPDNPGVAPAIDFINETIKAIRKNESSLSSYDAKILESIAKEFSKKDADGKVNLDSDKILFSLSKNDMKAMRLIEDINSSTANEALFTSGVVRGNRVNIISNYVHHAVTSSDASTQAQALVDKLLGVTPGGKVSTKAGTLNDRTPGAKPISFDPVYAAVKGAKDTLTDFYMTSEIRTVMSTMRDLKDFYSEQGSDQSNNIGIVNALYDALEESLKVTFQSHFHEDTSVESIVKKAQKLGYYTALASIPRAGAEFLSNVSYAVLSDPLTTISATKFVGAAYSTDFLGFLTKIGSSETIRLASTEMLSGKYSEGSSLSGYLSGGRSKAGNKVLDYMSFISKYSLSGVQNISSAVSEALISTPDKAISKPYYIAAFAKHFKNETGIDITPDDVRKMAEGTSEYLSPKFEKQLESARIKADREIVRLAASNNSFTTILKNAPRTSDSAMMSAYRSANSFMSRFYLTEYATLRSAVIALRKTGEISRAQATGIIAASTTRMSSYLILYSLLSSAFDSVISSMFDLPEEEEEEEGLMTKAKRSVTGQAVQMMTRRTLGNIGYIPVALAVENLNKEYGEDFGLRDGEYDPYKSSLVYAQVTEKDLQTKSPYEIAAKVSLGPYAPLASSVARFTVQTGRKMSQDSDKQILNAALESMDERAALEVSGNLGLLPFYKDIRRIMLSSMYASSNIEKNKSYIYSKDFIKTMESIDPEAAKEMKNKEKEMKAIFDEATGVQSSKKTKKDSELEIEEIIKKYYNK